MTGTPGTFRDTDRKTHPTPPSAWGTPYLTHVQLEDASLSLGVLRHLPGTPSCHPGPVPLLLQPGPRPPGKRGLNNSHYPLAWPTIPTCSCLYGHTRVRGPSSAQLCGGAGVQRSTVWIQGMYRLVRGGVSPVNQITALKRAMGE